MYFFGQNIYFDFLGHFANAKISFEKGHVFKHFPRYGQDCKAKRSSSGEYFMNSIPC